MQVKAVYKYARVSAFKVREVTREIQGKPVSQALDVLAFTPKKAALLVDKTLRSAVANAENNNSMDVDSLVIKEAVVGEGPTLKRWRARARGGAAPIHKRTSHIYIVLTDEIEIEKREKKSKSAKSKKATRKKSGAAASKKNEDNDARKSEDSAMAAAAAATAETASEENTDKKD